MSDGVGSRTSEVTCPTSHLLALAFSRLRGPLLFDWETKEKRRAYFCLFCPQAQACYSGCRKTTTGMPLFGSLSTRISFLPVDNMNANVYLSMPPAPFLAHGAGLQSILSSLKVRPASGQRHISQLVGEHSFHFVAPTHSDCPLAHLFSYYGPMFKNFHDPEVTLASSQPFDPWSRHQRRLRCNLLTRKRLPLLTSILKRNSVTSSNVCSLLVPSSYNLTFFTGLGVLSEASAHPLFPVFYDILPRCRFAPSSQLATNGQGRPHDCSLSAAVGGSMRSQMKAISNRTQV